MTRPFGFMSYARKAAPTSAVTTAAASQAPMRLRSAVSTAPAAEEPALRPKPTTKACAGRAMTSSMTSISSRLPAVAALPNRDHIGGQTIAENTPASAAVTGVGVIFMRGLLRLWRCGRRRCGQAELARRLVDRLARNRSAMLDRAGRSLNPPLDSALGLHCCGRCLACRGACGLGRTRRGRCTGQCKQAARCENVKVSDHLRCSTVRMHRPSTPRASGGRVVACHSGSRSGRWGVLRSEVKEEALAAGRCRGT